MGDTDRVVHAFGTHMVGSIEEKFWVAVRLYPRSCDLKIDRGFASNV